MGRSSSLRIVADRQQREHLPVIKEGGEPLFRPASTGTVELLHTKIFATGAAVHAYGPTSAA